MAVKNQLIECFHGDVTGIVVVTGYLAEDLCANTVEFLFIEGGMLKNVGEQGEPQVHIFLEYASRGGGKIFRTLDLQ